MPDLTEEDIGKKSQKPQTVNLSDETKGATIRSSDEVMGRQASADQQKSGDQQKNQQQEEIRDAYTETAAKTYPKGTKFYARFIHDPVGDSGRQNRENIADLKSGKIIRNNLPPSYWNGDLSKPPIGINTGDGNWEFTDL